MPILSRVAVGDEGGDRGVAEPGARVALLEAALAERDAQVAEQEAQLAALTEQVAR